MENQTTDLLSEDIKKLFVEKYTTMGPEKFSEFLISYSSQRMQNKDKKGVSPEIELINCYDQFLGLYRKEKEMIYLELAKTFRRSAHKIYRLMLKANLTKENLRFLNTVRDASN